jgi:hypothetical protein
MDGGDGNRIERGEGFVRFGFFLSILSLKSVLFENYPTRKQQKETSPPKIFSETIIVRESEPRRHEPAYYVPQIFLI